MGLDQTVTFGDKAPPAWEAVTDLLARHDFALQIRMIDGELAFPDEKPSDDWRELRVSTPAGMVTLRRETGQITLVIWGNADAALQRAANALAWAFAATGDGRVISAEKALGAAEFFAQTGLAAARS